MSANISNIKQTFWRPPQFFSVKSAADYLGNQGPVFHTGICQQKREPVTCRMKSIIVEEGLSIWFRITKSTHNFLIFSQNLPIETLCMDFITVSQCLNKSPFCFRKLSVSSILFEPYHKLKSPISDSTAMTPGSTAFHCCHLQKHLGVIQKGWTSDRK